MSDLRVLHINSSPGWGGMEMHPMVMADAFARRGHPVAFAMKQGSPMSRHGGERHFASLCLPFRWYLDPVSYYKLRDVVKDKGVNVIHVHYSKDTWSALLMAGVLKRKSSVVFTKHMGSPAAKKKDDPLHRLLVKRLDAMVAISAYMRGNILLTYPIQEAKVHVIHYGIGDEAIGRPEMAAEVRKKLGILPCEPLVGMVAQLSPDKRQDLFLQAADKVSRQFPACRFVLAGSTAHRGYAGKIESLVKSLGLERCVRLTGFFQDIPSLMQALDIMVLPSKEEAFGLVLLEAMANRCPLVASDSGAIAEIVHHGLNGLLVQAGDSDALADAIADLLKDPEKRKQMGMTGERLFTERFRLDREVKDTEMLYRCLLSNG